MSKDSNNINLGVSAKTRIIVAVVAIAAVAGGVFAIWYHHHKKNDQQSAVHVVGGPNISSVPGAGNPSDQYVKTQNQQNNLLAEKARKHGGSAVPTITRPSFIGNPDAFGVLPAAPSKPRTCPIKKVVVMFRPNPANCAVKNLEMARKAGVTAEELACQGCSLQALKLAGYTAGELKNVGYSAAQLKKAGFTLGQLKAAGFNAKDLKKAGFTAKQLADAGFTAGQLKAAGFTPAQIRKAGFSKAELAAAGLIGQSKASGKTSKACDVSALKKERAAGVSAITLRHKGCDLAALKAAGFSARALKAAGFSAAQLKAAGFSAKQLKDAGFSAKQLRDAGFSAAALKKAGFTAAQLKKAGFNAGQLAAAGFSAKQLKAAGFSAKQLRDAGFSAAQLKAAGFSAKQLKKAGYSDGDLLRAGFTPKQAGYATANAAKKAKAQRNAVASGASINKAMGVNGSSLPGVNSPEARLAAIVRASNANMSAQQRQDSIQQLQGAMSMQANSMAAEWGNHEKQTFQKANPVKKATANGAGVDGNGKGASALPGSIMKAGSVMFAVLDTSINTDERSPIMATIVDGPLKGSKLLGRFTRVNKRVLLSFNLLNDPRYYKSIPLNAVAIDPNTARTAISGQVNNHYLLKYGTVFASAFLSGLSDSILQSNSKSQCSLFGCVKNVSPLNTKQQITVGLGKAGQQISDDFGDKFRNMPPTIKIRGGTGIGILIMSDLKLPANARASRTH